jgi:hypothetical protein
MQGESPLNHSVFILLFSVHLSALFGQQMATPIPDIAPVASAKYLEEAPLIDGRIIDDPVWQQVIPFGDLRQTLPSYGAPASEQTDIRIGFDEDHIYISAICYDSSPSTLVVTDGRRDASLDAMDAFLFILDTYHDRQNGFVFGTNTVGVQYDGQVDNEGQGNFNNNRQQSGTIGGFNLNWDATWTVRTEVGEYGWSAEFAIPLKTLRYAAGVNQTWGINFQRNIQKNNEKSYWAQIPISFNIYRLSMAGRVEGLSLERPGNLKLIPYALTNMSKNFNEDPTTNDIDFNGGADIK